MQASDGVIFVLSPDSVRSPECAKELEQALALKKRIVPVLRREPGVAVPTALADSNWVYLRAGDDFETGLRKLVEALDADIEWVREHTRLGVRAAEWTSHDRNGAYLLRGSDLSQAESLSSPGLLTSNRNRVRSSWSTSRRPGPARGAASG